MQNKYISVLMLFLVLVFDASGQTSVKGLNAAVTVRKDSRSVPYISAKNDADLYFSQGYITASDRLWQMDIYRRLVRGETAEIFGDKALEQDKYWRRYGFVPVAEKSFTQMAPRLRAALENYARGVNAYIATLNKENTPTEFAILNYKPKSWTEVDTILIGKILADALSTTWDNDLLLDSLTELNKEKFADLKNNITPHDVVLFGSDGKARSSVERGNSAIDREQLSVAANARRDSLSMTGFYADELAASNNWVVSGSRTTTGLPLLANDPHLQATSPGIWYMVQLTTPEMRVAGVSIPGVPGVILGHNERIAWGATNVGPDVQDLYKEQLNDKGEYQTANGYQPLIIRRENNKRSYKSVVSGSAAD